MAWNRPTHTVCETAARPSQKALRRPTKLLLVGLAICCCLGIAIVMHQEAFTAVATIGSTRQENKGNRIGKGLALRPAVEATVRTQSVSTVEKPQLKAAKAIARPKDGRIIKLQRKEKPIFRNFSENFIAEMLVAQPGERFLEVDYSGSFDEQFADSLKTPITIDPNDDEDTVAVKKAVSQTKEQILRLMREEKSTAHDIVMEMRTELNRIADFRDQLTEGLNQVLVNDDDPNKVLDYVKDANKLLDEYEALHLDAPETAEEMQQLMLDYKEEHIKTKLRKLDAEEVKENRESK